MCKLLDKSYIVVSLYLLLSFFIDIVTKLTINFPISIGIILRGILLLYLLLVLLIKYKTKENYYIIGLLGIFSVIFVLIKRNTGSMVDIVKFNYFLIVFLYFINLYKYDHKKIPDSLLSFVLFTYCFIILIAFITRTSFNSYAVSRLGYVGWFNAANEISAIITAIVPFLFVKILKENNKLNIITLALGFVVSLIIGTRLPIVIYGISILYFAFMKLKKNNKFNKTNVIIALLFIAVLLYKLQDLPIFINIKEHLKFLGIKNPLKIFSNFKTLDHFIFNRRLSFARDLALIMDKVSLKFKFFGLKNIVKTAEMDIFDVFFTYGIIGFVIFVLVLTYMIKKIKNKHNINFLPIIMILITSFLSGHVILSPNVALIVIVVIINSIYVDDRKNILIAAENLNADGVGQSLVTFTNYINDPKYNITLYLKNSDRELFNELPQNISVKKYNYVSHKVKFINIINKMRFIIFNYKEYDFSCCYTTYSLDSNFMARYASNNTAIYIHSDYTILYKNDIKKINEFFLARRLDKFKHIIFVSNEAKDHLLSLYPRFIDKSRVINNFIDSNRYLELSNRKIKEKKPRGKKLFLFVGKIDNESKNIVRLINSFELALKENKKIELWIIGSGPDEKKIKKMIKDKKLDYNIKMLGLKENPYPYFKLCDYIILTSNYEGFPVIYGEAITFNKKIITTIDVSDNEITIKDNFGYICQKNEEDIKNTIIRVLTNDNLRYSKINIDEINDKRLQKLKELIEK